MAKIYSGLDEYNLERLRSGLDSLSVGYPTGYSGSKIFTQPTPTGYVKNPFVGPGAGGRTIPTYGDPYAGLPRVQPGVSYLPESARNIPSATAPSAKKTTPTVPTTRNTITQPVAPQAPAVTADNIKIPSYGLSEQEKEEYKLAEDIIKGYRSDFESDIPSEEDLYNQRLRMFQGEIDTINSIYFDMINRAISQGQQREERALGQNRAIQARSGLLGSTFGQAQATRTEAAQEELTNAEVAILANEQAQKIAALMGQARRDASEELKTKRDAKQKGAEKLLEYYNVLPELRASKASSFIKNLIAQGIDIKDLTPAELSDIAKSYKISETELESLYNDNYAEVAKNQATSEKEQLQVEKLRKEIDQIGKMTPYQAAQLGISAGHLKIAQERAAKEKAEEYKNYDESSIPEDVKSDLIADLQSNKNTRRRDRKSVVDFFGAYPEVETSYLVDLFGQYN